MAVAISAATQPTSPLSNTASIGLYTRWGFQPAPQYGIIFRHWPEWPEWPEGVKNGYIFMEATKAELNV